MTPSATAYIETLRLRAAVYREKSQEEGDAGNTRAAVWLRAVAAEVDRIAQDLETVFARVTAEATFGVEVAA